MKKKKKRGGDNMFKRGPFDFNPFQQQNTSQNVYDAEFTESEPKEPKKPKKKINFGFR